MAMVALTSSQHKLHQEESGRQDLGGCELEAPLSGTIGTVTRRICLVQGRCQR